VGDKYLLKLNTKRKTDSKQVPRGKAEKHSGKRVKSARNHTEFSLGNRTKKLLFSVNSVHSIASSEWPKVILQAELLIVGGIVVLSVLETVLSLSLFHSRCNTPIAFTFTVVSVPSWNTDHGVWLICKYDRIYTRLRSESNYGILVSTSLVWFVYELIADLRKEFEHIRQDPKDGDLYLSWSKPGETLVEDLRCCWRANHLSNLSIGAKDSSNHLVAGNTRNFPQDSWKK